MKILKICQMLNLAGYTPRTRCEYEWGESRIFGLGPRYLEVHH